MEDISVENSERGQWFVIHTLSSRERKVRDTIERQLAQSDELPVYEVFVPTENVSEFRPGTGVAHVRTRLLFPGYIWVRMDLYNENGYIDDKAWYFIRNVQGVLGFLGSSNHPEPIPESQVAELKAQSSDKADAKPKVAYEIGETVRIKDGSFKNFEGVVQEIDNERGKLRLMVSIFGRSTPVELELWQVERSV